MSHFTLPCMVEAGLRAFETYADKYYNMFNILNVRIVRKLEQKEFCLPLNKQLIL